MMSTASTIFSRWSLPNGQSVLIAGRFVPLMILAAWMMTACTHFFSPDMQRDEAAEQIVAKLKQTNADLVQFKCIGEIRISGPGQPVKSLRAAMAGKLADHLRIDMFAPFGGAAGTVASDGKHLFLVMHRSREYHKKRFGDGSLQRFIKMDLTVGDLLEFMVGRIPVADELLPRLMPSEEKIGTHLHLIDRWGRTRQRISIDAAGRPFRAVWYDTGGQPLFTLTVSGDQVIDGFVLPAQIDLSAASGQQVSIILDRYEANALLDDDLFAPAPI